MTDALLSIDGLHSGYGMVPVLHGVSLQIPRGAVTTLIGRNGMGKTTTVKTIMGQLPARQGAMRLAGADITRLADWRVARAGIGLVPEGRAIFPNLSVRENLICGAANRHRSTTPWTLERVYGIFPRLKEREGNLGANLSGGEQQMLAIGRALMTNPLLLILDEATEGLAPLIVAEIWRVIGQIRDTGISTLIVDRDYRRVLAHTDRAAVMEKGRIVMAGASDALAGDGSALTQLLGV